MTEAINAKRYFIPDEFNKKNQEAVLPHICSCGMHHSVYQRSFIERACLYKRLSLISYATYEQLEYLESYEAAHGAVKPLDRTDYCKRRAREKGGNWQKYARKGLDNGLSLREFLLQELLADQHSNKLQNDEALCQGVVRQKHRLPKGDG